jgi:hypothetical protein
LSGHFSRSLPAIGTSAIIPKPAATPKALRSREV